MSTTYNKDHNIIIPWNDFRIPDWVTHAAIDEDGSLTFFEIVPYQNNMYNVWDSFCNWYTIPHYTKYCMDGIIWQETLEERPKNNDNSFYKIIIKPLLNQDAENKIEANNSNDIKEYIKKMDLDPSKKYKFAKDIIDEEDD